MFCEKQGNDLNIICRASKVIDEEAALTRRPSTSYKGSSRCCFLACFLCKTSSVVVVSILALITCGDFILVSHCSEHSNHGIDRAHTFLNRSIFTNKRKRNNHNSYSQLIESKKENPIFSRKVDANQSRKDINKEGLLQVPCSVASAASGTNSVREKSTDLTAYVDTGATHTIMFYDTMKRTNLLHLMDRNPSFLCATSVGGEHVHIVGRIPAGLVSLVLGSPASDSSNYNNFQPSTITLSPEIYVLERTGSQSVDLLLGLDVLNLCKARICLQSKCLSLSHPSTLLSDVNNDLLDAAGWATSFASSSSEVNIPFIDPSDDDSYSPEQDGEGDQEDFGLVHRDFDLFSRSNKKNDDVEHEDWKDDITEEVYHDDDISHYNSSCKIYDTVMNKNDASNVLYYEDESQRDDDEVVMYADDNDSPIDFSGM